MRADLSEWSRRLSSLAEFEPPVAGWRAVVAARASRETRLDFGVPVALAAIILATTTGLALWLQSARSALTAVSSAVAVGVADAAGAARWLRELMGALALPTHLPEIGVARGDVEAWFRSINLERLGNHPCSFTRDDFNRMAEALA